ncbi:CPXV166 protein, partial [Monkeypox virus]
FY